MNDSINTFNLVNRISELLNVFKWSEHYHSTSSESKAQVHTGPALLKTAVIENASGSNLYVQVFDVIEEPIAGTVPLLQVPLPATTVGSFRFNQKMDNGIYVALSSTQFTYTDAAIAGSLNVEFKSLTR